MWHYSRLLLSVSHRLHSHGRQWHTQEHFLNVILPETRHFDIHSAVGVKGTPLWTVLSRSIETLQKAQQAKWSWVWRFEVNIRYCNKDHTLKTSHYLSSSYPSTNITVLNKYRQIHFIFFHYYSALEAGLAGTRDQSCDRYGSGHCILGKFLGVVCHCFPPPTYIIHP